MDSRGYFMKRSWKFGNNHFIKDLIDFAYKNGLNEISWKDKRILDRPCKRNT